jgi:hypothetical protein
LLPIQRHSRSLAAHLPFMVAGGLPGSSSGAAAAGASAGAGNSSLGGIDDYDESQDVGGVKSKKSLGKVYIDWFCRARVR